LLDISKVTIEINIIDYESKARHLPAFAVELKLCIMSGRTIPINDPFYDYNEIFEDDACYRRGFPFCVAMCLTVLFALDLTQIVIMSQRPMVGLTIGWLVVSSIDIFLIIFTLVAYKFRSLTGIAIAMLLIAINWICHIVLLAFVCVHFQKKTMAEDPTGKMVRISNTADVCLQVFIIVFYGGLSSMAVGFHSILNGYRLRPYEDIMVM